MINPTVFRAYDIRGSSPLDINVELAYKLGYCFSKMHMTKTSSKICVGRDARLSSDDLYAALTQGVMDAGCDVLSVGVGPTPLLYFCDQEFTPAASIMITGSHNPKSDNGFKMVVKGKSFFGEQIQVLLHKINKTQWDKVVTNNSARIETCHSAECEYLRDLIHNIYVNEKLKICWDPANGAACTMLKHLQNVLPNKNIIINGEMDGNFPNHHPDPTVPKNLRQLINVVRRRKCDCGIAFDGDADRIGVVTKSGRIVWGDQLLSIFAKDVLKMTPGAIIIADVKASQTVFDIVESHGGKPLMWKTGHALIKTKMQEVGAILAGEMSGHLFFADRYYGYDDGIYAAIRLLELLSKYNISLDQMVDDLPEVYNTPEIRIRLAVNTKFAIIEQIKDELQKQAIVFNDIDGLRVNTEHGWWLVRASNTEEAIIARCESTTIEGLEKLQQDLRVLLTKFSKLSSF